MANEITVNRRSVARAGGQLAAGAAVTGLVVWAAFALADLLVLPLGWVRYALELAVAGVGVVVLLGLLVLAGVAWRECGRPVARVEALTRARWWAAAAVPTAGTLAGVAAWAGTVASTSAAASTIAPLVYARGVAPLVPYGALVGFAVVVRAVLDRRLDSAAGPDGRRAALADTAYVPAVVARFSKVAAAQAAGWDAAPRLVRGARVLPVLLVGATGLLAYSGLRVLDQRSASQQVLLVFLSYCLLTGGAMAAFTLLGRRASRLAQRPLADLAAIGTLRRQAWWASGAAALAGLGGPPLLTWVELRASGETPLATVVAYTGLLLLLAGVAVHAVLRVLAAGAGAESAALPDVPAAARLSAEGPMSGSPAAGRAGRGRLVAVAMSTTMTAAASLGFAGWSITTSLEELVAKPAAAPTNLCAALDSRRLSALVPEAAVATRPVTRADLDGSTTEAWCEATFSGSAAGTSSPGAGAGLAPASLGGSARLTVGLTRIGAAYGKTAPYRALEDFRYACGSLRSLDSGTRVPMSFEGIGDEACGRAAVETFIDGQTVEIELYAVRGADLLDISYRREMGEPGRAAAQLRALAKSLLTAVDRDTP